MAGDVIERLNRYIEEHGRMHGFTDVIHGLHVGTDREAVLTVDDLKDAVNELTSLRPTTTAKRAKGK